MIGFRKKKEEPTKYGYRRRGREPQGSMWDTMNILEKLIFIGGPILVAFITNILLENVIVIYWLRVIASIGITILLHTLIWLWSDWMSKEEWY